MSIGIASGLSTAGTKQITDWIPTNISNCILWLRADKGTTIATGVSQWNDQSGNGHNVTQSTGSKQPTLNASDSNYNYQSTLSFASANAQVMLSSAWSNNQPTTIFVVGNMSGSNGGEAFFDWTSTELTIYNGNSGTHVVAYAGVGVSGTISSTSVPAAYAAIYNTTSSSIYQNNSQIALATGDAGSSNGTGQMSVGALVGTVDFLNGKIAEMLVYSGVLSTSNIQQVFAYFGSRYALSVS
jgi:hypothetical protein